MSKNKSKELDLLSNSISAADNSSIATKVFLGTTPTGPAGLSNSTICNKSKVEQFIIKDGYKYCSYIDDAKPSVNETRHDKSFTTVDYPNQIKNSTIGKVDNTMANDITVRINPFDHNKYEKYGSSISTTGEKVCVPTTIIPDHTTKKIINTKKSIYPKTKRVSYTPEKACLTEKMDGENLTFINSNNHLLICLRYTIFDFEDLENNKEILSKPLYKWLSDHGDELLKTIYKGSAVCGEWMGSKRAVKYPDGTWDKLYYMFAKARCDESSDHLDKFCRDRDLMDYVFVDKRRPDFIGVVPVVNYVDHMPTVEELNVIYDKYTSDVKRPVEGIVIDYYNHIEKYVRMKKGRLENHKEGGK